eukprot:3846127-Rhodomonas_salina.2
MRLIRAGQAQGDGRAMGREQVPFPGKPASVSGCCAAVYECCAAGYGCCAAGYGCITSIYGRTDSVVARTWVKGSGFNGDGTTAKYGCHEPNATDHSASPLCVARIIAILGCIADTSDNVDSTSRRRVRSSCKVGTPPESWNAFDFAAQAKPGTEKGDAGTSERARRDHGAVGREPGTIPATVVQNPTRISLCARYSYRMSGTAHATSLLTRVLYWCVAGSAYAHSVLMVIICMAYGATRCH